MEKRIFELTVSEFLELLNQQKTNVPVVPAQTEKRYLYSLRAMADELNMSVVTFQKLKNSGRIPYAQDGRKCVFEVGAVLAAMEVKRKGQKS